VRLCIVAFNACSISVSLEGVKGVFSKKNRVPPSSKTTLHCRPAITKFEPQFFGQHKLIKHSKNTWKMRKPNMQIRCKGRIGNGF
jgi:hypothetical protein